MTTSSKTDISAVTSTGPAYREMYDEQRARRVTASSEGHRDIAHKQTGKEQLLLVVPKVIAQSLFFVCYRTSQL